MADDGLAGLARLREGRSMRATSTFREGKDGNYDPNADPKGDYEEKSNRDNFRVRRLRGLRVRGWKRDVGDAAHRQDGHAHMTRRDHLWNRRHAHGVGARNAQKA